ncbi:MAG: sensor histidine kinase [Treponema sp.]|nr:sensor histidine kinase [Treponema sp.]
MTLTLEEAAELSAMLKSFISFFLIFDIVFFAALTAICIIGVKYFKSSSRLKESGEYLRYTIQGQEDERERIARELHDTVAQDLRWCAQAVGAAVSDDERNRVSSLLVKTLENVRALSYNLAPPDITRRNLAANVMDLCRSFQKRSGVALRLTVSEQLDLTYMTSEQSLNLYRIVQEALSNVEKHGQAQEVTLLMRGNVGEETRGMYLFVTDDGVGFESEALLKNPPKKHFGLTGMIERARLIGAKLQIDSHPGDGTQVSVFLALKPQTESVRVCDGGVCGGGL